MHYQILNCRAMTGGAFVDAATIEVRDGLIERVAVVAGSDARMKTIDFSGDRIAPGLFDIHVNGGGGVLFNDDPTVGGLEKIAAAHRQVGTTSILATLMSDDLSVIDRGMRAVEEAIRSGVPGIAGIHIEGPCLGPGKSGVHDVSTFRPLDAELVDLFSSLDVGLTLVTLAPEAAPAELIRSLVSRGVTVSLGHTNASAELAESALGSGATGFTHLFNAMSQLTNRAPGVVGAALAADEAWVCIIVDGHHVDPLCLQVAHRVKPREKIILVSDGMPLLGTNEDQFVLNGVPVRLQQGALRSDDGVLAGSAICLWEAVRNAQHALGLSLEASISMATCQPAEFLGAPMIASIRTGARADFIRLDERGAIVDVCIAGIWGKS